MVIKHTKNEGATESLFLNLTLNFSKDVYFLFSIFNKYYCFLEMFHTFYITDNA